MICNLRIRRDRTRQNGALPSAGRLPNRPVLTVASDRHRYRWHSQEIGRRHVTHDDRGEHEVVFSSPPGSRVDVRSRYGRRRRDETVDCFHGLPKVDAHPRPNALYRQ